VFLLLRVTTAKMYLNINNNTTVFRGDKNKVNNGIKNSIYIRQS